MPGSWSTVDVHDYGTGDGSQQVLDVDVGMEERPWPTVESPKPLLLRWSCACWKEGGEGLAEVGRQGD